MDWDFRKKKKAVVQEDLADEETCKEFEEDAQSYYKSIRAKLEKERAGKVVDKKKNSEEELKKKKEREAYYAEIRKIYQEKEKKKA